MTNEILIYIIAGSAIFSSTFSAFIILSRKSEHMEIIDHYIKEIDALSDFKKDYEYTLKQILETASAELKKDIDEIFYLRDKIDELESMLSKKYRTLEFDSKRYTSLELEIRKRDDIIERRNKKIEQLKKAKDGI